MIHDPDNPPYSTVLHYGKAFMSTLMVWHPTEGGEYKPTLFYIRSSREAAEKKTLEIAREFKVEVR